VSLRKNVRQNDCLGYEGQGPSHRDYTIGDWVIEIDGCLRETAMGRMPSEWAKKAECWDAMRDMPLPLPSPLPAELQVRTEKVRKTRAAAGRWFFPAVASVQPRR
jgi:hypothetical protein